MEVKTVPRSVKEIIDRYAPRETGEIVSIHKDDGTKCYAGGTCQRAHEVYHISYTRTLIQKGTKPIHYVDHHDCPHVGWSLKCPRTYEVCENCLIYKNRADEDFV